MTQITVDQQCLCGHPSCDRWGLSNGTFIQGTGFSHKDASRLAACWNALASLNPDAVADVVAALEGLVLYHESGGHEGDPDVVIDLARTALARIQGEG